MGCARSGHDAAAKDLGDDASRFSGTVDAIIGELIRRKALRVKRTKAGFVAEKRTASHGRAAGEKDLDWRIEPKDSDTGVAKEVRAACLRIGAAAKSEDGALLELGGASESGAQLIGFELAKGRFTVTFEELRDGDAGGFLNAVVEIDETPSELSSEQVADGGLAGTHESGESEDRDALRSGHADIGARSLRAIEDCSTGD